MVSLQVDGALCRSTTLQNVSQGYGLQHLSKFRTRVYYSTIIRKVRVLRVVQDFSSNRRVWALSIGRIWGLRIKALMTRIVISPA